MKWDNCLLNFKMELHRASYAKKIEHKIATIFLSITFNVYFGCSKEPSHQDGSFEYPQHVFWLRNKKKSFMHSYSGALSYQKCI